MALAVVPEQDVSLADRDLSLMMSKSITSSLYCKVLMKPEQNRWEERVAVLLQGTSSHHCAAAGLPASSLGAPRDVAQPLESPLQTSAIGPGGVKILVVIILFKFL